MHDQISQKLIFPVKVNRILQYQSLLLGVLQIFWVCFPSSMRIRLYSTWVTWRTVIMRRMNKSSDPYKASLVYTFHSALKSRPENTMVLSKGRNTQDVSFSNGLNSYSHWRFCFPRHPHGALGVGRFLDAVCLWVGNWGAVDWVYIRSEWLLGGVILSRESAHRWTE